MGLIMSGRARRPNQRAFMRILQAFGASSPFVVSSDGVVDPSAMNGVMAGLSLSTFAMLLYKSTVCCA